MSGDVFISYAHGNDQGFVKRLCDVLEEQGFRPWVDIYQIKPGEIWDKSIDRAIQECSLFMFVMTPASVASEVCHDEWSRALEFKKPIVPLMAKRVDPPLRLHLRQYIDFTSDIAAGMNRLVEHLHWLRSPEGELQILRDRLTDLEHVLELGLNTRSDALRIEIGELHEQIGYREQVLLDPQGSRGLQSQVTMASIQADIERFAHIREREARTSARRVVGNAPQGVSDFFRDRRHETAVITDLLVSTQSTVRVVNIYGRGGIGKTALACKVMSELENDREGVYGIIYLSTRTGLGINVERIYRSCIGFLGEDAEAHLQAIWKNKETDTAVKIQYLLDQLSNKRILILLDNFEDLLDREGQIIDPDLSLFMYLFLQREHDARLLITSREPYNPPIDVRRYAWFFPLEQGLDTADAVTLLISFDHDNTLGLANADPILLEAIAEKTYGFPRALEAVAGILAQDPFLSVASLVEDEDLFGGEVISHLVAEAQSRLSADARRVMQGLAVFGRPVTESAIVFMLESYLDSPIVSKILRQLARGRFLTVKKSTSEIFLHPLDVEYSYRQISREETDAFGVKALEIRAADYYALLRTPPSTWRSLADLEPQMLEFGHRIRSGEYQIAFDIIEQIDFDYLSKWGFVTRAAELRRSLLGKLTDSVQEEKNLGNLGVACFVLGRYDENIQCLTKALRISKDLGSLERSGQWLGQLGKTYRHLARFEVALDHLKRALAISRKRRDRVGEANWMGELGIVYRNMGQFGKSVNYLKNAVEIVSLVGTSRNRSVWLHHLALSYVELGNYQDSETCCRLALEIDQASGDRRREGNNLGVLGQIYAGLGRYNAAIEFSSRALEIAREIGDIRREGNHLSYLGKDYSELGQYELALESFQKALAIARSIGDRRRESENLGNLGNLYRSQGQYQEALSFHELGRTIAVEIGAHGNEGWHLSGLGETYLSLGNWDMALKTVLSALKIALQAKNPNEIQYRKTTVALIYLHSLDVTRALQSIKSARKETVSHDETRALAIHGLIMMRLGNRKEAQRVLNQAVQLADKALINTSLAYAAKYFRAFAISSLALLALHDEQEQLVERAKLAYDDAMKNCSSPGVVDDARRLTNELSVMDKDGILTLILNLLP